MNWTTEDVAFKARYDGSEQRYIRLLPEDFSAEAPHDLLVALHGHGSDRWQFVNDGRDECRAARDFASCKSMVYISPDYRDGTSWMGAAAESDVRQIIGEIRAEFNIQRVFVCGGSMGGTSSLTFAGLNSSMVDGVVAMNPAARPLDCTQFTDAIAAGYGGTPEEIPGEYEMRAAENRSEFFTMPVAITVSGKDTTVPPRSARRLARRLSGNGKKCLLIDRPELGHFTDYADAMDAFNYVYENSKKVESHNDGW